MVLAVLGRASALVVALWAQCRAAAAAEAVTADVRGSAPMRLYFGNGCFWARQHLFVEDLERRVLGRADAGITAVAGYAGSAHLGQGGTVCYHNPENRSDYGLLGHAEVVQVEVPLERLEAAFAVYFGSFVELSKGVWDRADYFDQGAEYRSLIGVPGGLGNAQVLSAMRKANLHNMTLQPGKGSDPDTFSLNKVFVMDNTRFPFVQAELCLQFHDDQRVKYPSAYHATRKILEGNGRLIASSCPGNYVCNSSAPVARPAPQRPGACAPGTACGPTAGRTLVV